MSPATPSRIDGSTVSQITDMSRIRRTRRTHEDTSGHDDPRNHVQEDTGGHVGTRADTTYAGFGTVRPRVQIPGPRPVSESRSVTYTLTPNAPGPPPRQGRAT